MKVTRRVTLFGGASLLAVAVAAPAAKAFEGLKTALLRKSREGFIS